MKKLVGLLGILGTVSFGSVVAVGITNATGNNVVFTDGIASSSYTGQPKIHSYNSHDEVTINIGLEVLETYGITTVSWTQSPHAQGTSGYESGSVVGTLTFAVHTNVPGEVTVEPLNGGYFTRSGTGTPSGESLNGNQLPYHLKQQGTGGATATSGATLTLISNGDDQTYTVEVVVDQAANVGGQYTGQVKLKFTPDSVVASS